MLKDVPMGRWRYFKSQNEINGLKKLVKLDALDLKRLIYILINHFYYFYSIMHFTLIDRIMLVRLLRRLKNLIKTNRISMNYGILK